MPDENKKVYIKLHICYLLLDPAVVKLAGVALKKITGKLSYITV